MEAKAVKKPTSAKELVATIGKKPLLKWLKLGFNEAVQKGHIAPSEVEFNQEKIDQFDNLIQQI